MKPKILITGAAGLFGCNFSRYLLSKEYRVIGIDNFFGGYKENVPNNLQCINIDLSDNRAIDKVCYFEKPDYIYHFAAYAAEGLSHHIRNFNYQNNMIASANIINSAVKYGAKKIIFTSSMAVYGDKYNPPFTEEMTPSPIDPYGIAKYATEMDLKCANEYFGLKYSIVRPHNVIGLYQNLWDKYRNVIGIWIRQCLEGTPITIYGDGLQQRAFSDIAFYNEPLEKLMLTADCEIINIGSDKYYSLIETAEIMKQCAHNFGFNPDIIFLEKRKEAKYAYSNHNKAKQLLNFKDNTNLKNTINNMFEWALKQPKHEVRNLNYEIEKGIYSYWKV